MVLSRIVIAAVIGAVISALAAYFLSGSPSINVDGAKIFGSAAGSGKFFDDFAKTYDPLNRVISLGFDSSWRRAAVAKLLDGTDTDNVLDVGTGTGDVILYLLGHPSPPVSVVGLDPSREMLVHARRKLPDKSRVRLIVGVAEKMPFNSGEFSGAIVSFGVRNFAVRTTGLSEMVRVVRSGGKLVILEVGPSGDANGGLLTLAKNLFVSHVMPRAAALVSGHTWAYQYLAESMRTFPQVKEFKEMLREAGCGKDITHERLWPLGLGPDLYTCIAAKESEG